MILAYGLSINKNMIQKNNNKNIEFLGHNLIDITLEACQSIRQSKKHYLILKMGILVAESYFSFIIFFNFDLIGSISKV